MIYQQDRGNIATYGKIFHYVQLWSDTDTWGKDTLPQLNETVYIPAPGKVLYDVDSTPMLSLITVEGKLFIAPEYSAPFVVDETHVRTLDAMYIFVYCGYLEIGTEDYPYESQLTITLHSN